MRALVVDDDQLIRSNVAEVLSNEGWDVSEAPSVERALRCSKTTNGRLSSATCG
jgi:DNA-binding response OmpR family regulator